jgi:hypothetical protein
MPRKKAAPVTVEPGESVTNCVSGHDITLHDGRHLLFGETAVVPAELAAAMRKRGQVK